MHNGIMPNTSHSVCVKGWRVAESKKNWNNYYISMRKAEKLYA